MDVDGTIRALMDTMTSIMYTCEGIGMAAPQLGVLRRVIVADAGEGLISLANPEVISRDGEDCLLEGCLEHPGRHGQRQAGVRDRGARNRP